MRCDGLQVEQAIAHEQKRNDAEHLQIAGVVAGDDLARDDESERGKKRKVDGGGNAAPIQSETSMAARPAAQVRNSRSSGVPTTGRRPVQFGTAVSRNPATTAGT